MKTLETQHDNEVLKRTGLQGENKQLMDQVAELNTKEKQLCKVRIRIVYHEEIAQMRPMYVHCTVTKSPETSNIMAKKGMYDKCLILRVI